jgi:dihydroorotase
LQLMLSFYFKGKISLERIVEKMCHAPAECFHVEKRGYLDEGNWADVIIVDLDKKKMVKKSNILYKCQWSPLEHKILRGSVDATIVSGHLAYENGVFFEEKMGERLLFSTTV